MTRWRQVPGWEAYEASDAGQVRSVDRTIPHYCGGTRLIRGKVLRPIVRNGYPHVTLYRGGVPRILGAHQVVMLAFVGPPPDGLEVLHGDGDRGNPALANLRYGTSSENQRDKRRHGTDPYVNRERCPEGHRLEQPNLVRAQLLLGWRQCRACHQTHAYLRSHSDLDFKVESDRRYRVIMAGSAWHTPGDAPAHVPVQRGTDAARVGGVPGAR